MTFTSALCCELLAQVKREWEGAAASVQALPEGSVPESSTVQVFGWVDAGAHHPARELPQQCFGWLCQHRDVTHLGTGMLDLQEQSYWEARPFL